MSARIGVELDAPVVDLLPEFSVAGTGVGAAFSEDDMPVVLSTLEDGTGCVYIGMRCGPKAA
ncbi:hypothetical protein [Streptomyces sp. NPDC088180]|uniref:hypothetical protein n=1 Tax=Streptomyces sp. NPDC088180 TaxID=3365837 RepID=UPI0037F823F7